MHAQVAAQERHEEIRVLLEAALRKLVEGAR
jgi:hypothetical protein